MHKIRAGLMLATIVIITVLLIVVSVELSGGTFGQQCARMFPNDPRREHMCVVNLSHGVQQP